ncbi:Naphthalene 1,2-dioxygenase system ferredoxin subunit [Phycisphaerae bacterium RAS1]|nr:Naphthalene 1,2-dioxygenase system ferredoxin subunit [Phycisphaerae bacterium RAS1]
MSGDAWNDVGAVDELRSRPLQQITVGRVKLALSCVNGQFSAISGVCNHAAGPLGEGRLDGEYVVCPWHNWKFHCRTGLGEPGYEDDAVPRHDVKVENGRVLINLTPASPRTRKPHAPHPLSRPIARGEGPVRVLGVSTTAMDSGNPRYSTSDALLEHALDFAARQRGAETRLIRLNDLKFRHCEGYYSKSSRACTWPCSITQMDPADQLDRVYESIVHWTDVILIATPIRWGGASSLYYKMVERMNCIQNQITIANKVLMHNKVAAFIITGGQDNVQAVAGQMLGFFAELGCHLPPFPYIAHSRGWSAEDMERNVRCVAESAELRAGAADLVARAIEVATILLAAAPSDDRTQRGGRKAHQLDVKSQL